MVVGSTVGGMVPALWGDIGLSFSSLFLSALFAAAGVVLGWRFGD